jgi:hypothetical protein
MDEKEKLVDQLRAFIGERCENYVMVMTIEGIDYIVYSNPTYALGSREIVGRKVNYDLDRCEEEWLKGKEGES